MNKVWAQSIGVILLFSLSSSITCFGQDGETYPLVEHPDYVLFVISERSDTSLHDWIKEASAQVQQQKWQVNFLHINGKSSEEIKAYVNHKLYNPSGSNLRHTYILLIGGKAFIEDQRYLYRTSLFVKKTELYTDQQPIACKRCFPWGQQGLSALLKDFSKAYLWEIDLAEARKNALESSKTKQQEREIGFFINQSFNYGKQEGYLPRSVTSYGLRYGKHFKPNWRCNIEGEFGYSIPDLQSIFQTQVREQVDISALQSGIDQDVELSATLEGYFYGAMSANLQYVFYKPERSWETYVTAGFSLIGQLGFQSQIDTMITIDASELTGGGGMGALGGQTGDRSALQNERQTPLFASRIPLGVGWRGYLNKRLSLDISATHSLDLAPLQGNDLYVNAMQLKFNLSYHFWPKRKNFYRYLR